MTDPREALREHKRLFARALAISQAKRADYTKSDDPFGNYRQSEFFDVEPWRNVGARLMEKLSRFKQLAAKHGKHKVSDEDMENTIVDALNFIVIMYQMWKEDQIKTPQ